MPSLFSSLFGDKKAQQSEPPSQQSAPAEAAAPVLPRAPAPGSGGRISLSKGASISLTKPKAGAKITATCSWPPATDYDVFALVAYRDGHVETVSQFGTVGRERDFSPRTRDSAVVHLGDVKRSAAALASESVEVVLGPDIAAVVPVVYSAKNNGTGSFRKYHVTMSIDNGMGDQVVIDATNASKDDQVYSCVPGIIINDAGGQARIEALEHYSRPGSELRPIVTPDLRVLMDQGEENAYKE